MAKQMMAIITLLISLEEFILGIITTRNVMYELLGFFSFFVIFNDIMTRNYSIQNV